MKFALVNGEKTEAQPETRRGACLFCQSETIAKCGDVKIWHWAHKSKVSCDPWFQNSAIRPEEVQSREKFYKNMAWVVNGTRLKNNYPHFCKGFSNLRPLKSISGIFLSLVPRACFPASWLNSSVPIYLDFQDNDPANQQDRLRSPLWCLFPGRMEGYAVVAGVPREDFIKFSSEAPHFLFAREMLNNISQVISERKKYPQVTLYPQYTRRFPSHRL